jgi:hypothetical protein
MPEHPCLKSLALPSGIHTRESLCFQQLSISLGGRGRGHGGVGRYTYMHKYTHGVFQTAYPHVYPYLCFANLQSLFCIMQRSPIPSLLMCAYMFN